MTEYPCDGSLIDKSFCEKENKALFAAIYNDGTLKTEDYVKDFVPVLDIPIAVFRHNGELYIPVFLTPYDVIKFAKRNLDMPRSSYAYVTIMCLADQTIDGLKPKFLLLSYPGKIRNMECEIFKLDKDTKLVPA